MKKIVLLITCMSGIFMLQGQSVDEAKSLIIHERYKSANQLLHNIIKDNPGNETAWYLLTRSYLQQENLEAIEDSLTKVPADLLNAPMVKVAKGHILLNQNKAAEATMHFNDALKQTKNKNAAVLEGVARAQFEAAAGNAAYGVELVNKAIKRDKRNPALYNLLGDLYRKLGDGSQSYRAYEQALKVDPNNAVAKYKLGKIFISQNNAEYYLKYFKEAVQADSLYAPALYELYYHYYFRDVNVAMDYLKKYIAATDYRINNEYMMTDLLFASRKYQEAIESAQAFISKHGERAEPRLYKLIAYSFKELNQPQQAATYMNAYFANAADSNYVIKDYEAMADIFAALGNKSDSAALYYSKAAMMATNDTLKAGYYKKLAELYKTSKDHDQEAFWLGKYYASSPVQSNVDLFNWGVAHYMAREYEKADSVFGVYEEKYPEQRFGYYWRARSNAALDSNMEKGLAIPHYLNVINISEKDTTDDTNRKRLIEAYGYLAAYKANTEKDFAAAINYFEKLLALDPANNDAKKYIDILKKNLAGN